MHVYKKVLATETIYCSLMNNFMHLLKLSVIFNIFLELPKIKAFARKCAAKSWVWDMSMATVWEVALGLALRLALGQLLWSLGCRCFSGTEMPLGRSKPSWEQSRTGRKPYGENIFCLEKE